MPRHGDHIYIVFVYSSAWTAFFYPFPPPPPPPPSHYSSCLFVGFLLSIRTEFINPPDRIVCVCARFWNQPYNLIPNHRHCICILVLSHVYRVIWFVHAKWYDIQSVDQKSFSCLYNVVKHFYDKFKSLSMLVFVFDNSAESFTNVIKISNRYFKKLGCLH